MRRIGSILLAMLVMVGAMAAGCRVREGSKDDTPQDQDVTRPLGDEDAYRAKGHSEAMRARPPVDDPGETDGD
ncbi:MAG: hypothetical protein JXL80_01910 [Planctomycetes bacterium]|nr:hypothetical protein [Planctomycetota bacterium]